MRFIARAYWLFLNCLFRRANRLQYSSTKEVMCHELLLGETVRCCGFSREMFIKLRQGGSYEQETNVSGRRDGRCWTNGAGRCSAALSVESGFTANHSGRLASHGRNNDGQGCFH